MSEDDDDEACREEAAPKHVGGREVLLTEFEESASWYESQRDGLGFEFVAEVDRVLVRIAHEDKFAGAPITTVEGGVVRREFVDRFPYVVAFVETDDERRMIMIRPGTSDPARWRGCL